MCVNSCKNIICQICLCLPACGIKVDSFISIKGIRAVIAADTAVGSTVVTSTGNMLKVITFFAVRVNINYLTRSYRRRSQPLLARRSEQSLLPDNGITTQQGNRVKGMVCGIAGQGIRTPGIGRLRITIGINNDVVSQFSPDTLRLIFGKHLVKPACTNTSVTTTLGFTFNDSLPICRIGRA